MNTTSRRASAAALAVSGVLTFSGGFALLAGSADASTHVTAASTTSPAYPTPPASPTSPSYPTTPASPTSPSYPTTPATPTYPTSPATPTTPATPTSPAVSPSSASPSAHHHHGVSPEHAHPSTTKHSGVSPSSTAPTSIESGLATTSHDTSQQVMARGLIASGALLVLGSLLYLVGFRRRGFGRG